MRMFIVDEPEDIDKLPNLGDLFPEYTKKVNKNKHLRTGSN
jgi:hypothetical protein